MGPVAAAAIGVVAVGHRGRIGGILVEPQTRERAPRFEPPTHRVPLRERPRHVAAVERTGNARVVPRQALQRRTRRVDVGEPHHTAHIVRQSVRS